jgi:hypothetical protein
MSMLIVLLILTGLSVVALIVGFAWTLMISGENRRRSGPDVGAEIMAEQMMDDDGAQTVAQQTYFAGKATEMEREASISFAEIKEQVRSGRLQDVLPVLLALGGLFGLLLFGSLAAWVGLENKLVAGVIVVVAFYALVRAVLAFARA